MGDGGMVCLEEPGWGERKEASSMFVILNVRQNLKSPATQMFFQYPDVWQGTDHVPSSREALGILSLTSSLQRLLTARSEHPVSSHHPLSGVEFFFLQNLYTWMIRVTRSRFLKAVEAVI